MISVIWDIDGTLCEVTEGRVSLVTGPGGKDWDAFHEDAVFEEPRTHLVNLCRVLDEVGYNTLLSTGRPEQYREDTKLWLQKYGIPWHRIWMRPEGDKRSSNDVKREHYAQMISAGYQPVMSFDDRVSNVALWRELGITTLQVAEGRF